VAPSCSTFVHAFVQKSGGTFVRVESRSACFPELTAAPILPGMSLYEPILARLNEQGRRILVVGGLAVVLHGLARLTADLDSEPTQAEDRAASMSHAHQPKLRRASALSRLPVRPDEPRSRIRSLFSSSSPS